MQTSALVVPLVLGAVAVLQATLNRQVAATWGLAPASVLNMLVGLAWAGAFLLVVQAGRLDPELSRVEVRLGQMRWWWVLPGLFGFGLVTGLPWAVDKLGAQPVFVAVVGAQMVTSLLWDAYVEGVGVSAPRLLGGLLAVASVGLVSWK